MFPFKKTSRWSLSGLRGRGKHVHLGQVSRKKGLVEQGMYKEQENSLEWPDHAGLDISREALSVQTAVCTALCSHPAPATQQSWAVLTQSRMDGCDLQRRTALYTELTT